MPRPKSSTPKKTVTFYLDERTQLQLTLLTLNPVTGAPKQGMKSLIVNKLINKLVAARQQGETQIDVSDLMVLLH